MKNSNDIYNMQKKIGIIPARLNSVRVPRKAIVDIHGLPMCVHVYRRALMSEVLDEVVIATDSIEVMNVAKAHGAKAVITKSSHVNGTERMAEVLETHDSDIAVLINGDEPLIDPDHIGVSVNTLIKSNADASMLARKFDKFDSPSDFKIVLNVAGDVMYISRADIPSNARNTIPYMLKAYHIMAFHKHTLEKYAAMTKTPMESLEDHEHLRLIENGYKIRAAVVESNCISVDVPEDLEYVKSVIPGDPYWPKYKDNGL